jgi:hypothetical protein
VRAALALLLVASLPGAAKDLTIVAGGPRDAERIGSYRFGVQPTYAAAVKAFGRPATLGPDEAGRSCIARWANLGLDVRFASGAAKPCARDSLRSGSWAGATVYAGEWRTAAGLRVGDTVARLRRLYPQARYADRPPLPPRWLLVYRRGEVGLTVSLEAFVWARRVTGLDLPSGNVSVARGG